MQKLEFPKGFLWGASSAAHQVEGNNVNDWSVTETADADKLVQRAKVLKLYSDELQALAEVRENYISGAASDHFNHYKEDYQMAKSLNHNATRCSIEWSRIEPKEGQFDQNAIEHYVEVLKTIKSLGLKTIVTLWHYTLPVWVAEQGGWENKKTVDDFAKFVEHILQYIDPFVDYYCTVNEPEVYANMAYLSGERTPFKKNILTYTKVMSNIAEGHKMVFKTIKNYNQNAKVGFSKHNTYFVAATNSIPNRIAVRFAKWFMNEYFLKKVLGSLDYIGLNYYFKITIDLTYNKIKTGKFLSANGENKKEYISDLNSELSPEGVYHVLMDLKEYNLPIIITELGLADHKDLYRERYIRETIEQCHKAIENGVDLKGYIYWSLTDNFEWDIGFLARFGLIEINYKTFTRTIRKSAYEFARIAGDNSLTI